MGIKTDTNYVHEALKLRFLFIYKKVSSRLFLDGSYQHALLQKIFEVEYLNLLSTEFLFVSIDEALFSNRAKLNYSWARKEKLLIFKVLSCFISLITAMTSYGG